LNKISTVTLVCPKFIYFVFTPHSNYIIILNIKFALKNLQIDLATLFGYLELSSKFQMVSMKE
jgi:hypothetical protein